MAPCLITLPKQQPTFPVLVTGEELKFKEDTKGTFFFFLTSLTLLQTELVLKHL